MSNLNVEPQGEVRLLRAGLSVDNANQLTWQTQQAQYTYFHDTCAIKSYQDFVYVRQNNSITVEDNIDVIRTCNYLMYKNNGFTDRWFYAFITDMEYVNENCTRIYFTVDSFQTWYFEIEYHPCFVEREHTNDDTVGANTVPEGLETGEYICIGNEYYNGLDDFIYVIQATEDTSGNSKIGTDYGGVVMIGGAYLCSTSGKFLTKVEAYHTSQVTTPDAIINCYIVPRKFIENNLSDQVTEEWWNGQHQPSVDVYTVPKKDSPGEDLSFHPKNNKLKTYPYVYLLVSNNNGSSNILKYEDWVGQDYCSFSLKGVPTPGCSIKLTPGNYVGCTEEDGLMAGKFPQLNWNSNGFTNWLTQNGVNIGLGVASSGLQFVGSAVTAGASALTGNFVGAIAGTASAVNNALDVRSSMQEVNQHSMQPDSAKGNTNGGDINVCSHKNGFYFYAMSIKTEYARMIDEYFSMYGYKTNRVKIPNIGDRRIVNNVETNKGRYDWNYVKTIGCNFTGKAGVGMSQEDEANIRRMFDNGVTLWHNPSHEYDYTRTNGIVP
jgi:hypothetical protein